MVVVEMSNFLGAPASLLHAVLSPPVLLGVVHLHAAGSVRKPLRTCSTRVGNSGG